MMGWFALQRRKDGTTYPVFHDEKPIREHASLVVEGSLKEIPPELSGASLSDVARWAATGGAPEPEQGHVAAPRAPIVGFTKPFNLNSNVTVKLTDMGCSIWNDYWDDFSDTGAMQKKVHADGTLIEQLWTIMEIFGKHLSNRGPLVMETEILLHLEEP